MKINSVLGPIDSAQLGQTLMHEHVSCADWSMRMNFGERFFDRAEVIRSAKYFFSEARNLGVCTVVDGTPVNLGRDVELIRDTALATGLNFIVSSGFYHQEEPWLQSRTTEEMYEYLIDECVNGINRTGILPGILKCACDKDGLTPLIERLLNATARASAESGLPIFCHTAPEHHTTDLAVDALINAGAAPERIIAGHSGDTDDVDYLEGILRRGVYLGIDRFGMSDYSDQPHDERGIELIIELTKRGWSHRLMLSHDTAAYLAFAIPGEPCWENRHDKLSFSRIHKVIIPTLLSKGIDMERIVSMLVDNPRRYFEGKL